MFMPPKWPDAASPMQMFRAGTELGMMVWEAQSVIALRMLGMSGMWAVAPSENSRMVAEKLPAFQKSAIAAMTAMTTGKRPDEVLNAAVRPLRSKTRSNVRRLSKRGPRLPSL